MSVSVMSEWMVTVPQDEVKSRYGLEAHEWAGSLSDRVMAIINKNDPTREDQVNALLHDNAVLLEERFHGHRRLGPDEDLIDYAEFRDAIACVVENGVSINDETYSEIHYVDSTCVRSLSKALLRPYHEVYPNANVQVYYRRELREQGYQKPDDSYINQRAVTLMASLQLRPLHPKVLARGLLRRCFPVAVSLLVARRLVYDQRLRLTSQHHRGQIRMKPMMASSCKVL